MTDTHATPEGEQITAAAIRQGNIFFSVKRPGRHHDVIRGMADVGMPTPIGGEQGFLTSSGRFVGRKEARRVADAAGQIITSCIGPDDVPFTREHSELFSEDVW